MSTPDTKPSFLKPTPSPYELSIESHGRPIGSMSWEGGHVLVAWRPGPLVVLYTEFNLLKQIVETGTHVEEVIASRGGVVQGYEHLASVKPTKPR